MLSEKKALREQLRRAMSALTPAERETSDEKLFARFLALPQVEAAETILLFYGLWGEPDTKALLAPLLARGKRVLLPCCRPGYRLEARQVSEDTALVPGVWNIPEPPEDAPLLEKDEIDLILVPNLCCDRFGIRLGQGGGYYDRYLEHFGGLTVSLCRGAFLQPSLPREAHDVPIQVVLTEEETLVP